MPERRIQLPVRDQLTRSGHIATRPPTESEVASALAFVRAQGAEYGDPNHPKAWSDFCHVLWNVKEFVYVP